MTRAYVHNLPSEVLGHVFDLATDRNPTTPAGNDRSYSYLTPNQMDDTHCPRNVMLVCKHWHQIALRDVSIWTHLSSDKHHEPLPPPSLMSYWLSLSRGAELRLCIREDQGPSMDAGVHTLEMIRLYASQAHRIRSLEAHLSQRGLCHLFSLIIKENFIILDELQIYEHPSVRMPYLKESLNHAIERLVSFRHLTLHQASWPGLAIQHTFAIPWEYLETLDLRSCIPIEDAIWIIRSCTCASTIRLGGINKLSSVATTIQGVITTGNLAPGRTVSPRLAHLTLNGSRIHPMPLLQYFILPNLTTLTVTSGARSSLQYELLENLLNAQGSAEPNLRKITIHNRYSFIPRELPSFIRAARELGSVKEVSTSYSIPSIYHLYQLLGSQAPYDFNGGPAASAFPASRLGMWIETRMIKTGPLDVYIGWQCDTSEYTLVAQWTEDGSLQYLHPTSI